MARFPTVLVTVQRTERSCFHEGNARSAHSSSGAACAAVLAVQGPFPAHHLLSAFPAIPLEAAGKLPLVRIQGFPPSCCMLHISVVSQADALFPLLAIRGIGLWCVEKHRSMLRCL